MNGKERVQRAVRFQDPDRVPVMLPGPLGSDIARADVGKDPDFTPAAEGQDEWGCIWSKVTVNDTTMGQVSVHPLKDYAMLENYPFPDYSKEIRYEYLRNIIPKIGEKFVLAGLPIALNHRVEYMRGPENAWTDPYLYPEGIRALLERITHIGETVIEKYAEIGGVDGIFWHDDWGLQDRLMISPEIFREFFLPFYKRIFDKAHQNGMLTFMHSCGNIVEILDDFIQAGLDVIQMDQQENMGLELLSKRFGGRICFWCPVDIQKTMVEGSVEDVQAYAKKLIDRLGCFHGGFIAKWYISPQAVNHTQEKIDAMCRTFVEYGGKVYNE